MKITVRMNPTSKILADKGLNEKGDVQRFHTSNVLRRIVRYMPYRTGATIKLTQVQTNVNKPYIVTDTPYAKYLYYGKSMAGKPPKTVTGRDLHYTKTKNPLAGPFWDRTLVASEGTLLAKELQRYIDGKVGRL